MFPGDGDYITYKRQRGVGNIFHSESESEAEGSMGDINEQPEDNTMHILNDLERGQNDLVRGQNDMVRGNNSWLSFSPSL
jgi:hypothetical protein